MLLIFSIVKISDSKKASHKNHKMTIGKKPQAVRTLLQKGMELLPALGIHRLIQVFLIEVEVVAIAASGIYLLISL